MGKEKPAVEFQHDITNWLPSEEVEPMPSYANPVPNVHCSWFFFTTTCGKPIVWTIPPPDSENSSMYASRAMNEPEVVTVVRAIAPLPMRTATRLPGVNETPLLITRSQVGDGVAVTVGGEVATDVGVTALDGDWVLAGEAVDVSEPVRDTLSEVVEVVDTVLADEPVTAGDRVAEGETEAVEVTDDVEDCVAAAETEAAGV